MLALNMFKADAIALVRAGVNMDIETSRELLEPPAESEFRNRRNLVRQWERCSKPFAAEQEPFYALLRSVVTDPVLVAQGLPGAQTNKMSVESFCAHVYDVAKEGGIKPGLMIVPKGSFLPVCRVALRAITQAFGKNTPAYNRLMFIKVFAKALALSDIHHFPYKSTKVTVGHPSIAPEWDSWCTFGGAAVTADSTIRRSTLLPEESVGLALRAALKGAAENNILGDWYCANVRLADLPDVLKHEKLPLNFVMLGDANYVTKNMDWVIENFDFTNKLHTLALMYGFIVKHLNPGIYTPTNYTELLRNMHIQPDRKSTLAGLRRLEWLNKGGNTAAGKGNTHTDIFVVMFTALVIGIYSPHSPLGEYMEAHSHTLGKAVTTKYGKFPCFTIGLGMR